MKKRFFVILLAAFLIWGFWPVEKSEAVTPYEPDQIIRLHIRAQDDSQEAQAKKLLSKARGRMQRFGWERNIFQIGYTRALCILRASMKRLL